VQFSPEFTAAVEAKQIAQQEAQRAAFIVDRAVQEKQGTPAISLTHATNRGLSVAMIVSAQGEAMSAELIGKAVQRNAGYVTLRRIETAKEFRGFWLKGTINLCWMLIPCYLMSGIMRSSPPI